MKYLFALLSVLALISCREEDSSKEQCFSDCTEIKGRVFTTGNLPVSNAKLEMVYHQTGTLSHFSDILKKSTTGNSGEYQMSFFIKDSYLNTTSSYYKLNADFSKLGDDYLFPRNTSSSSDGTIITIPNKGSGITFQSLQRNSTTVQDFYVPKKTYIKVTLNGFQADGDNRFSVFNSFTFGPKKDTDDPLLELPYSIYNTGFETYIAHSQSQTFLVECAADEVNILTVSRRKNGENTSEQIRHIVPKNNSIELTYQF